MEKIHTFHHKNKNKNRSVRALAIITISFVGLILPVWGIWRVSGLVHSIFFHNTQTIGGKGAQNTVKSSTGVALAQQPTIPSPEENARVEPPPQNPHTTAGEQVTSITDMNTAVYPIHTGVSATYFWVGEPADKDNKDISNAPSAWDDNWQQHFGGVDDPKKRSGFLPAKFTPNENPFYVALPYNDFDSKGNRRSDALAIIPWANEKAWKKNESMLKNQWVKITKGDKTAYAQWEDVGPFGENDASYVFGTAKPKSKTNEDAGIDLSPAASQYLDLQDIDTVDWQFVDEKDVPAGPWKQIVTTSQIYWT